jgi:hypothetical protein
MDEIVKKLNELRELMNGSKIISCYISNIEDRKTADILVSTIEDLPTGVANYKKLPKSIGGWVKKVTIDGVKFEAYCSYEKVIEEIKKEEGITESDEAGDAEND